MTITTDATKDVHIHVTPDEIVKGAPGNDMACAVALAANKRKGVKSASIGATVAYIEYTNGKTLRYIVHPDTQAIIKAFDKTGTFPVITAHLLAPTGKKRWGARTGERHGTNVRSGKKVTVARHLARQAMRHVHDPS